MTSSLQSDKNDIIDAIGAAEILGIHPVTVRRLACERRIPGRRVGKVWRFSKSVLVEWVKGDVSCFPALRPTEGATK